jgi:hypothetical protein
MLRTLKNKGRDERMIMNFSPYPSKATGKRPKENKMRHYIEIQKSSDQTNVSFGWRVFE